MGMDIKEIMSIIPHRQPFLLIDRVEEIVEGEKLLQPKMFPIMNHFCRTFSAGTGDAGCVDRGSNGAGGR